MLRKMVLALAFTMLPAAAMAQEHQHHAPAANKHEHKMAGEHKDFAQQLIAMRAELNLTDAQITKLTALSAKMKEHHKAMAAHHKAMADGAHEMKMNDEGKLHAELLAVFTEDQLKQVRPLMRAHMDGMCKKDGDKQCKMDAAKAHPKE